jgi:prepilin-type N-terminal cleavage/methylation domain-containing protein
MNRGKHAQAGFTLIEVLIGIALLAMLGSLIANGVRIGGRAWSNAERQSASSDDMVLVQSLFQRTIVRAMPAYATAQLRDPTIAFSGETDSLRLVAPLPGTEYGGPWVEQRFYVGRQGKSGALFATLSFENAPAADDRARPASPVMLLDHVSRVRFAYFGAPGAGQAPAWQESWVNRDRLPALVRIAIVRDDPRLRPWPDFFVRTRVTANASCIYDVYANGCRRMR